MGGEDEDKNSRSHSMDGDHVSLSQSSAEKEATRIWLHKQMAVSQTGKDRTTYPREMQRPGT